MPFIKYNGYREMSNLSVADIEEHLKEFIDPLTGKTIMSGKALKNVTLVNDELGVEVVLGYPAAGIKAVSYTHLTLPTNREV